MKALVLKTNGMAEMVEFDRSTSYDTIKNGVGGFIEVLSFPEYDMWCNEEGKIIGLPMNLPATLLFQAHFGPSDIICGDVVFTGHPDEEGDTTGLNGDPLADILEMVPSAIKWEVGA